LHIDCYVIIILEVAIKKIISVVVILFLASTSVAATNNIEKIIVIRHGEKPITDLGQLSCAGLNRSLILPNYFHSHFQKPNYIFAPNPSILNAGFSYVRALATIEPTAISFGMPVSTQIGYDRPEDLAKTLLEDKYHRSTIIVAWEHKNIIKLANILFKQFNANLISPTWSNNNYNMVFVFTINWNTKPVSLDFKVTSENLKNINKVCPNNI